MSKLVAGPQAGLTRRTLLGAAGGLGALGAAGFSPTSAFAQAYPNTTVRVMLGYAAGGGADIVARYYSQKVQELAGQPFVVMNRPGAGGNIGAQQAAHAKPDGYTLLMAPNIAFLGNIHAYKDPGYHPTKDFTGVTTLAILPFVFAVGPKSPINSMQDLVAHIKQRNGAATYGGTTTTAVLATEMLLREIGGKATKVPYKSMGDSVPDLAGQLDFVVADGTFAAGQARAGRMKLLAVTTLQRSGSSPDVPTMDELGFKGYEVPAWWAVYAPKATPPDVIAKLEGWFNQVAATEETKKFLLNVATDPYVSDTKTLNRLMEQETKKWGELMELAGVEKQ
ncbi:MAG TPA: tripartite tricarboxylate transporter substrate binding protein [Beijerinckiaceae bacterium]|jgi:tripartite-type tricarboxylate transporter receptor subunit TctC